MYINYKKNYKNKDIVNYIFAFVFVLIQSAFFYTIWTYYYNELLNQPYLLKGNFFVSGIYAIIYALFMIVFDSEKIGENKLSSSILSQTLTIFFTNILVYFVIIMPTYAKGFVFITPLMYTGLKQELFMILWEYLVYLIIKKLYPPLPMLLISNNNTIESLISKFNQRKDIYHIVESVNSEAKMNEIQDKCLKYVNVLVGDIESVKRNDIIKFCFENSINTYILPKLSDIIIKNSNNIYSLDTPMYISTNDGISLINEIIKRIFDIIFSIIGIIVLSPLLLLTALLIKIEDGGKVLFIQERVTKDEKLFKILKFRSMKENNSKEVRPTEKDDDRITKIGHIIRATHIDELPQVFNVLVGDMSLVGPRPERKEHVDLYSKEIPEFKYRHKTRTGLTGLAQVYGRYNTTAYDKLKLDLMYIKNYSLLLDIEILFKTIKVLIIKEKTEGFDKAQSDYINKNAK